MSSSTRPHWSWTTEEECKARCMYPATWDLKSWNERVDAEQLLVDTCKETGY